MLAIDKDYSTRNKQENPKETIFHRKLGKRGRSRSQWTERKSGEEGKREKVKVDKWEVCGE